MLVVNESQNLKSSAGAQWNREYIKQVMMESSGIAVVGGMELQIWPFGLN